MGQPPSAASAAKNTAVTSARFMKIRVASNVPETSNLQALPGGMGAVWARYGRGRGARGLGNRETRMKDFAVKWATW